MKRVRIHVQLDEAILNAVREKLQDEQTGTIPYGMLSRLITALLAQWLMKENTNA